MEHRGAEAARAWLPEALSAGDLAGFRTTPNGSTRPRRGRVGGVGFVAKCGSWSELSSDAHVVNEWLTDGFLRSCGLAVPVSGLYRVDFGDGLGAQAVRLSRAVDGTPLAQAWAGASRAGRDALRAEALRSYPAQAFCAGIDSFQNDNALVGEDGTLWFVDNGAGFGFRARGGRKEWFFSRTDPDDPGTGYLSLARRPEQRLLGEMLGEVPDGALREEARRWDFGALFAALPEGLKCPALGAYAAALDVWKRGAKARARRGRGLFSSARAGR